MIEVLFLETDTVPDSKIEYSVIVATHGGKLVLCKNKNRDTWEIPGGHREQGETPEQAAKRELFEETGALEYSISELFRYAVKQNGSKSCGAVFWADIEAFGDLPDFEISETALFDELPPNLTYPQIQPLLLKKAQSLVK